jgi:hypothetical protein
MAVGIISSFYWTYIIIKTSCRTWKHEKGKVNFKMFVLNLMLWLSVVIYFAFSINFEQLNIICDHVNNGGIFDNLKQHTDKVVELVPEEYNWMHV